MLHVRHVRLALTWFLTADSVRPGKRRAISFHLHAAKGTSAGKKLLVYHERWGSIPDPAETGSETGVSACRPSWCRP
eukprot:774936-Pelagomonas_calceolata.AAC.4